MPSCALADDYQAAFRACLRRDDEAALARGYDLGRAAVITGTSLLQVAQVHHDVLHDALLEAPPDDLPRVLTIATRLLSEVLAAFELTRLGPLGRPPSPVGPVRAPKPTGDR